MAEDGKAAEFTSPPAIYRVVHRQARIDGTALEICEWANFNNMEFHPPGTEPVMLESGWANFTVARHDLKPLSQEEVEIFQQNAPYRHRHPLNSTVIDTRSLAVGGYTRHVNGIVMGSSTECGSKEADPSGKQNLVRTSVVSPKTERRNRDR